MAEGKHEAATIAAAGARARQAGGSVFGAALRRSLGTGGRYLGQTMRLMVGMPDYERYVAHVQRVHPGQTPMSYEEFFSQPSGRPLRRARQGGVLLSCGSVLPGATAREGAVCPAALIGPIIAGVMPRRLCSGSWAFCVHSNASTTEEVCERK